MVLDWNYDVLQFSGTAVKSATKNIKLQKNSEDEKKPTQHKQTRMIPSLSRIHCSSPHIDLIDQD